MCGIFGAITQTPDESFKIAFERIKHRGPDSSKVTQWQMSPWHVQYGHHRLSIIDLESGQQPMQKDDWAIIFNGEIYNYKTIAKSLKNPQLQTHSDTEVILEAFREQGLSSLLSLDGFFGFGIIRFSTSEVWLARDRWGIKPLYYTITPDKGLIFGSELSPFQSLKTISAELDLEAFDQYLFWEHFPGDKTPYKAVKKLRPGHFLHWKNGTINIDSFYKPSSLLALPRKPTTAEQTWRQITQAVDEAMIADVPVGVLLSGGIDSSLVAVAAAQKMGKGIPTFSIGFTDPAFDESPYAKSVADQIQSEHHVQIIGESDLLNRWEGIVDGMDEPLADPSILPTRLLCELAVQKVKVVLGGDGGDELFGGYPTYRAHQMKWLLDALPSPIMHGLQTIIGAAPTGSGYQPLGWKLKRLVNRYDQDLVRCHFKWMSGTDESDISILSPRSTKLIQDKHLLDESDPVSMMWLDLIHYLPYTVLTKVDRASMAVGLEARPPFLTNSFVNYAMSVPAQQKISSQQTKIILREAAKTYLPDAVVKRAKRGFAIPLASWLKGPLKPEVENIIKISPLWDELKYDREYFQTQWTGFLSGRLDLSKTVWAMLVAHRWLIRR